MRYFLLSVCLLGLGACSDNDNKPAPAETFDYKVSLMNLTNGQPFSPPAAILHDDTYSAWSTGQSASVELETLAESGDASQLVNSPGSNPGFSSTDVLTPGALQSFDISTTDKLLTQLTLATMLVNTNDAFTGLTGVSLEGMQKGDVRVYYSQAYDAGTEFNDELAANIPGPAGGGEGFNAARNDVTAVVTNHGGVVSQDDGYAGSALTETDRFDNSVMRIEVMRL